MVTSLLTAPRDTPTARQQGTECRDRTPLRGRLELAPERNLRVDRLGWATRRVIATEWSLSDRRRTRPGLSSAGPAGTEETGALGLPPRTELLQPSGTSQLVYVAHERRHYLFVA